MLTTIGPIIPATPPTKAILKMFDPTILLRSIANSPFLSIDTGTTNSLSLVRIATKVNPINSSGILAKVAKFFGPNMRESDPPYSGAVACKIITKEK